MNIFKLLIVISFFAVSARADILCNVTNSSSFKSILVLDSANSMTIFSSTMMQDLDSEENPFNEFSFMATSNTQKQTIRGTQYFNFIGEVTYSVSGDISKTTYLMILRKDNYDEIYGDIITTNDNVQISPAQVKCVTKKIFF